MKIHKTFRNCPTLYEGCPVPEFSNSEKSFFLKSFLNRPNSGSKSYHCGFWPEKKFWLTNQLYFGSGHQVKGNKECVEICSKCGILFSSYEPQRYVQVY